MVPTAELYFTSWSPYSIRLPAHTGIGMPDAVQQQDAVQHGIGAEMV